MRRHSSGFTVRISEIAREPISEVRYLNAASRGGTSVERFPIVFGKAAALPPDLDALVLCSDLQGIVPDPDGRAELLGIALAAQLEELAYDGVLPPCARTGVILAGDLYSVPEANKRGGHGDVSSVWAAFAERFAWVDGVAGNHDAIDPEAVAAHAHVLDGTVVTVDTIRIGGVGLISGNPAKRGRRDEEAQLALVQQTIDAGIDILVLHEGPHGDAEQPGNAAIRALVDAADVPLVVCGHVHWDDALATGRGQIVNVDTRVVVLAR